jgi:hypothetical protein
MVYMTKEIKEALQELANRKGREHYDLGITKQVINAFRDNTDHFLKADVLEILKVKFPQAKYRTKEDAPCHLVVKKKRLASQKQFNEFYCVTRAYLGAIKDLASLAGVCPSTVSHTANRGEITLERYNQFKPYFKEILKCKNT